MVGTGSHARQTASAAKPRPFPGSAWPVAVRPTYIHEVPKRNVILLVVVCLSCLAAYAAREQAAAGRRVGEVLSLVRSSYYEPVDDERLFEAAVDAALGELDEHSAYIRGGDRSELEATLDQTFGGVGLELAIDERRRLPVVSSPVIDSPAWHAGVRAGDWIEAVDGESTVGRPLREVVGRLRGAVGEAVTMQVATASPMPVATLDPTAPSAEPIARRDVMLVRERIETESVVGDRRDPAGRWEWMLEGAPGIGYVRITSFGERTAGELAKALAAIEATGDVRGIVMDLRGNPGGLMTAAVEACDLMLDEGVIVHTRRHRSNAAGATLVDSRRATAGASLRGVAVAVLVDGLTASAAEIVAACLQDAGRATVVGSRTFGKGTVQSILPLSDDRGLLKLTTSEYLRPSQETIHRREGDDDDDVWGVSPDTGCEVAPTAETVARVAAWRRARDAAGPVPSWMAVSGLPRDVDPVLSRGIDVISARANLSGQEETAGDQHESAATGD
jgi:carboxyl-terminal processing protease